MLEKIYINKPDHTDLNMYRCGIEDCSPGHSWGPALRDHYIIHYVRSGKGIFQMNNTTYQLEKSQGFLIPPNTIIYYQADNEEPWSYSWVGFHGLKAEQYLKRASISQENPVFKYDKDNFLKECIDEMIIASKTLVKSSEIRLLGLLYIFLSQLIEVAQIDRTPGHTENRKEQYIKKAINFIEMNYSRKINISEIAQFVGLDRSYLFTIFKEYLNTSPQDFLINYRVNKACELMQNKLLSIGEISRSVGYEDPLLFSKVFRKIKGIPPKELRKGMAKGGE